MARILRQTARACHTGGMSTHTIHVRPGVVDQIRATTPEQTAKAAAHTMGISREQYRRIRRDLPIPGHTLATIAAHTGLTLDEVAEVRPIEVER